MGLHLGTSAAVIQGAMARTVKVKMEPKKPGKVMTSFKATSENAGGQTTTEKIKVKK
jgi:hypothetical protein